MRHFLLFGTDACHLCEQAHELLLTAGAGRDFTLEEVDISIDDDLFDRYGLIIPVVRHPDGQEISWPFDLDRLSEFLSS